MARSLLHLLVILLGFSHLISLNAVPIRRTRDILSFTRVLPASDNNTHRHQEASTEESWEEKFMSDRIDLEKNDYAPVANGRHTPPKPAPIRT
uniref:Uncharacterized protein n=1 Tax=Nelumbo nucifera TaxID=4432 RepID=A0A822YJ06_NELNU|nr:TPA_asm: hypothetical protein HUJ06_010130 [Nelumbo nucifera]